MAPTTLKAVSSLIGGALFLGGCANQSFYRGKANAVKPTPVAAKDVKVYKQKDDLSEEYVELGLYRGSAPTVDEAMDRAKQTCGDNGGSFYILNTPPFKSGKQYRVDGVCAAPADAQDAEPRTDGKKV